MMGYSCCLRTVFVCRLNTAAGLQYARVEITIFTRELLLIPGDRKKMFTEDQCRNISMQV